MRHDHKASVRPNLVVSEIKQLTETIFNENHLQNDLLAKGRFNSPEYLESKMREDEARQKRTELYEELNECDWD